MKAEEIGNFINLILIADSVLLVLLNYLFNLCKKKKQ